MSKINLDRISEEQKEQGDPINSAEEKLKVKLLKNLTDFASSSDSDNSKFNFALNFFL